MSERKRPREDEPLPLPAPRPDAALDEKILAYARARAPRREAMQPRRWIAGLATAGIVAVAVMITLPQQSPSPTLQEAELRAPQAQSAAAAAGEAAADVAAIKPSRKQTPERRQEESVEQVAKEQAPTAAGAAYAPAADSDGPSAGLAAARAGALADSAEAVATAPPRGPGADAVRQKLEYYRELLTSGKETQARKEYQQLRENCADCLLPDTLEQALETLPPQD